MCGREQHGGGEVRLANPSLQCLQDCDRSRRVRRTILLRLIPHLRPLLRRSLHQTPPEICQGSPWAGSVAHFIGGRESLRHFVVVFQPVDLPAGHVLLPGELCTFGISFSGSQLTLTPGYFSGGGSVQVSDPFCPSSIDPGSPRPGRFSFRPLSPRKVPDVRTA